MIADTPQSPPVKSLLRTAVEEERRRREVTAPRTVEEHLKVLRLEIAAMSGALESLRRQVDLLEQSCRPAKEPAGPPLEEIGDEVVIIQDVVARQYGFKRRDILSRRRPENLVWARHAAIHLASVLTGKSDSAMGRRFNRDHRSISHALNTVAGRIQVEKGRAAQIARLEEILRNRLNRP